MALAFGPPEYFAVYFLAFASFVGMGGAPPIKTVVSLAIGFAIAAIGIDTVSGSVRLTMGIDELVKGVNFVVAVMGLFGIGELLVAVEEEFHVKAVSSKIEWREVLRTLGRPAAPWLGAAAQRRDRLLDGDYAGRPDRGVVHELRHRQASSRRGARTSARASPKASSRRRPPTMPPAPARCCRCCRSAFPARRPPPS